jgi:aspartate 1-decarboxylase
MYITILKSKIHRATVTSADREYEGSISIDTDLMKAAALIHHQHVHVWNVTNGSRFETYVIPAPKSSGVIQINGAAAHHAKAGDYVIISSFGHLSEAQAKKHKPRIVFVDAKNRVKNITRMSGGPDNNNGKLPI